MTQFNRKDYWCELHHSFKCSWMNQEKWWKTPTAPSLHRTPTVRAASCWPSWTSEGGRSSGNSVLLQSRCSRWDSSASCRCSTPPLKRTEEEQEQLKLPGLKYSTTDGATLDATQAWWQLHSRTLNSWRDNTEFSYLWRGAAAPGGGWCSAAGLAVFAASLLVTPDVLERHLEAGVHVKGSGKLREPGHHRIAFDAGGALLVTPVLGGAAVIPIWAAHSLDRKWDRKWNRRLFSLKWNRCGV